MFNIIFNVDEGGRLKLFGCLFDCFVVMVSIPPPPPDSSISCSNLKHASYCSLVDFVYYFAFRKGSKRADLIPSPTANVKWPQIVIKFYEDRVTWTQNNENGES